MAEPKVEPAPKGGPKPAHVEHKTAAAVPAPKAVPLQFPKGPDGKAAEGLPQAPVARAGAVPRLVHQNERAPEGLRRYKILAVNVSPARPRYVLARDAASAKDYYVRCLGPLPEKAPDGKDFVPELAVQELRD